VHESAGHTDTSASHLCSDLCLTTPLRSLELVVQRRPARIRPASHLQQRASTIGVSGVPAASLHKQLSLPHHFVALLGTLLTLLTVSFQRRLDIAIALLFSASPTAQRA
jgi:hypothetical protein